MIGIIIACFVYFFVISLIYHSVQETVNKGEKCWQDYRFNLIFCMLAGVWGFIFFADGFTGKLCGAMFLSVIGWLVSFIFSGITGLIPQKAIKAILRAIVCGTLLFFIFTTEYSGPVEDDFDIPSDSNNICCVCPNQAYAKYGDSYYCSRHYYLAKGMDGDFDP